MNIYTRILIFILTLFVVMVSPWWLSAIFIISLIIFIDFFIEAIFFGFLIDALYSTTYGYIYPALFLSVIVLLLVTFVKTQIRT